MVDQVLDHEIVHVVLGQAFWPRRVPRWLQEGLAQWYAGEFGPETTRQIAQGALGGGLLTLEELTGSFPSGTARARLAYAQSVDLVAWIAARHGEDALRTLVRELAAGQPLRASFRTATGRSLEELDRAWRSRLEASPPWLTTLFSDTTLLGLGGLVLVAAAWMVRRRNRRRIAAWKREEELLEALWAPPAAAPIHPVVGPDDDHPAGGWIH